MYYDSHLLMKQIGLTIALAIIALGIHFWIAKAFETIALNKGYRVEETHAFAKCFWLGIYGMIYVAALPQRTGNYDYQKLISSVGNSRNEHKEILNKLTELERRIEDLQQNQKGE